jgi:hypothetical protein
VTESLVGPCLVGLIKLLYCIVHFSHIEGELLGFGGICHMPLASFVMFSLCHMPLGFVHNISHLQLRLLLTAAAACKLSVRDAHAFGADHAGPPFLRGSLLLQELFLFPPALLQIHKGRQQQHAQDAQAEQEVERQAVVGLGRTGVDDRRAHDGPDEGARLAHDAEETEEEELLATWCDLGDHDLGIRVPRTDEEPVEDLVKPEFPFVVEPELLRPVT